MTRPDAAHANEGQGVSVAEGVGLIADAPRDGTQIIVPTGPDLFNVVAYWAGGWRETANGLRLRDEPTVFAHIPAALRSAAEAARSGGVE
jgi:hypothetical protein